MNMIVDSNRIKAVTALNLSSRYIYTILHGFRVEGKITANYSDIIEYTGISLKTIKKSIKELIDKEYITRISRGKYTINK